VAVLLKKIPQVNYQTVKVGAMDNASDEVWIYDNIVYSSTGKGMGIHSSSGNGKVYIWNNIVYDLNYADWGGGIYADEGTAYLYNNTIHNCYGSIQVDGSAVIYAKNNNCQDSVTSFDYAIFSSGTFHATSTNNIGSKTLAELCWGAAADSGTTDDAAANKLKDSDQNFLTTIKVGMVVKNTTDTTYSYVTAVDSNGILSLNDDIMANSENYTIYANMFGSVVFNDEAGDDFHLGATDTVAINKGYDTSGEAAPLNFTIDIDGDTRSTWDIGADEYVSEEPPAGRTRRMFLSMK
jgi:hypothetical protein